MNGQQDLRVAEKGKIVEVVEKEGGGDLSCQKSDALNNSFFLVDKKNLFTPISLRCFFSKATLSSFNKI